jgi:hypothetical protein
MIDMKRVVGGKTYNTATATEIVELPCSFSGSDFRSETTSLYRTENGRFFIAGEGGPMTRWAESKGINCWGWGEGLFPISSEEAREFMEEGGCSADEFVAAGFSVEEA